VSAQNSHSHRSKEKPRFAGGATNGNLPRALGRENCRRRLANRRACETFELEVGGLHYVVSVGHFADGVLAEIFITNGKAGSDSDTAARDSAVVASIALQFGVPLDVLRHALMRDGQGRPSGPLGTALDLIAKQEGAP
jgi:hypothetical protein